MSTNNRFAFVDVETTGANPLDDRIIDVGIILVDDNIVSREWETLINPERSIHPFISAITGIRNQHVEDAPVFSDMAREIFELLAERVFVAHNARFDYMFLKHEFLRLGKQFTAPQLCTVRLSRRLYPQEHRHGLDAIIERFNLSKIGRHRALPDAKSVYLFIESSKRLFGDESVSEAVDRIVKRPSLPSHVPLDEINALPNTVGVYIFYDQEGLPLYVGKSLRIRDRVLSHFYDDTFSLKELQLKQRVAHIEPLVCAGELDALLKESRFVKELLPLSNRLLRRAKGMWVAKKTHTAAGYISLAVEAVTSLTYDDHRQLAAIAKTKSHIIGILTKTCEEHGLCMKLAGLEKGKGACFSYHLGTCLGACIGKEMSDEYNARVEKAFSALSLSDWPYTGPIVVHERNEETEIEIFHLIDNWMVIRSASEYDDLFTAAAQASHIEWDEYKILKKQLPKIKSKQILR